MRITENKFIALSYDLTVGEDGARELMERATAERPLKFIFGTDGMLPAFEKKLKGLNIGDEFHFTLAPEDAHGKYNEEDVLELPRKIFEKNGQFDDTVVYEGNAVPMRNSDGLLLSGLVREVRDDVVLMDFNHPLAGETLHFDGQVLDVHVATAEEIAELASPQGGCGCDGSCSEEDCKSDCDCDCDCKGDCKSDCDCGCDSGDSEGKSGC
ncbi:MAG: FKBP-type peptidyl-prolyl cis-trans isomerase [Tannerella sp.]|jgi:FKBP-type peptidyl-prolyl cis-trans isomerase SlyD|nr:FKBP-type peptidyl-prolyl cis-trans isomerase [Tannerella sp.]